MKIIREMFNRSNDTWEFLTDDGHVLTKEDTDGRHTQWVLYEVEPAEVLGENWSGEPVWDHTADFYAEPATVVAAYNRHQASQYECELFADLGPETKGELHLAHHHIEAGDLRGAFQHLIQFATWAMQEYADIPEVGEAWEQFGPHYGRNGHLHVIYDEKSGWQLCDKLNKSFYGPLCPNCHRPHGMCICKPPEEPHCEQCGHWISECHCRVQIPF
jgi:hypothetical protein